MPTDLESGLRRALVRLDARLKELESKTGGAVGPFVNVTGRSIASGILLTTVNSGIAIADPTDIEKGPLFATFRDVGNNLPFNAISTGEMKLKSTDDSTFPIKKDDRLYLYTNGRVANKALHDTTAHIDFEIGFALDDEFRGETRVFLSNLTGVAATGGGSGNVTAALPIATGAAVIGRDGAFDVRGADSLFVDDITNRVGINTTTPSGPLEVQGPDSALIEMVRTDKTVNASAAMNFSLHNSADADAPYSRVRAFILANDVGAQEGGMFLDYVKAGVFVNGLRIQAAAATFNEGNDDMDVIVRGGVSNNLLHVDAGLDRVGIGTGSPEQKFDVNGAAIVRGNLLVDGDGVEIRLFGLSSEQLPKLHSRETDNGKDYFIEQDGDFLSVSREEAANFVIKFVSSGTKFWDNAAGAGGQVGSMDNAGAFQCDASIQIGSGVVADEISDDETLGSDSATALVSERAIAAAIAAGGGGGGTQPHVRAYLNDASQTVSNSTWTVFKPDTPEHDEPSGNMWVGGVNAGRITLAVAGHYDGVSKQRWDANSTNQRGQRILLDGSSFFSRGGDARDAISGATFNATIIGDMNFRFGAGDYWVCEVLQNSGLTLNISTARQSSYNAAWKTSDL